MGESDDAVISRSRVFVDIYARALAEAETCCNPSPPETGVPTGSAAIFMN